MFIFIFSCISLIFKYIHINLNTMMDSILDREHHVRGSAFNV